MLSMFLKINGWIALLPFFIALLERYRLSDRWETLPNSAIGHVGALVIVGSLLLIVFLRKAYRMSVILDRGKVTRGLIEARLRLGFLQILSFRFSDHEGQARRVANLQINRKRHRGLKDGQEIEVIFDPLAPDHGYWSGDLREPNRP